MEKKRRIVQFVDPESHEECIEENNFLLNANTKKKIASIIGGIPRFVSKDENYAESFGWQWNKWEDTRSESRGSRLALREVVLERTRFEEFDLKGKVILECGMGGGDDTEILLSFPFCEIHSFDISTSVERAAKYITDGRLVICQASIFKMPYPDNIFDVVFCHRVLQHTPDPVLALKEICSKVKPGGILFAHAYKRSWRHMLGWRYKYRWLTKRLPHKWLYWYVQHLGKVIFEINRIMYRNLVSRILAYNFIPFYHNKAWESRGDKGLELLKLVTFDALTPYHDHPMSPQEFFGTIKAEGFEIRYAHDPKISPMWCTAIKNLS